MLQRIEDWTDAYNNGGKFQPVTASRLSRVSWLGFFTRPRPSRAAPTWILPMVPATETGWIYSGQTIRQGAWSCPSMADHGCGLMQLLVASGGRAACPWLCRGVPSYTVCPAIRVGGIAREIGEAITFAASRVEGSIRLIGHSEGGHLVSRMAE